MARPRRRNVPGDRAEITFVVCMSSVFRYCTQATMLTSSEFRSVWTLPFCFIVYRSVSSLHIHSCPCKYISVSRCWKHLYAAYLKATGNGKMISKIDDGRSLTCDDIAYLFPGVDECPARIPVDGPCQFTFAERAGMKDTH